MTTFLLVRHAAHDWLGRGLAGRLPGVGLNGPGKEQAQALVQRLADAPLQAIYCSPQQRTQETAAPLAGQRRLTVHIDAAFDEIDFGRWTGRTFGELEAEREAWAHWCERRGSATPPGGEPFAGVAQRALAGLKRLLREHPDQQVMVVSHGDVIKAVVATVLDMSLDHLERFEIAPASVTVLAMGEGWQQLRLLNAQGPLR
ncbi:MAG TPA: histidine phosphatase family protein [Ramlibacter sp.]|nr:histidine phosphatase family protein [Ramlibacter sp.]